MTKNKVISEIYLVLYFLVPGNIILQKKHWDYVFGAV